MDTLPHYYFCIFLTWEFLSHVHQPLRRQLLATSGFRAVCLAIWGMHAATRTLQEDRVCCSDKFRTTNLPIEGHHSLFHNHVYHNSERKIVQGSLSTESKGRWGKKLSNTITHIQLDTLACQALMPSRFERCNMSPVFRILIADHFLLWTCLLANIMTAQF